MSPASLIADHHGKPSSSRVVSIGAFVTASVLALAPLVGGPHRRTSRPIVFAGLALGIKGWARGVEARETIAEAERSRCWRIGLSGGHRKTW